MSTPRSSTPPSSTHRSGSPTRHGPAPPTCSPCGPPPASPFPPRKSSSLLLQMASTLPVRPPPYKHLFLSCLPIKPQAEQNSFRSINIIFYLYEAVMSVSEEAAISVWLLKTKKINCSNEGFATSTRPATIALSKTRTQKTSSATMATKNAMEVVKNLDLQRYMGRWYVDLVVDVSKLQ
ncbi:hypothetical protein ACFX12_007457 [Malus domestica]